MRTWMAYNIGFWHVKFWLYEYHKIYTCKSGICFVNQQNDMQQKCVSWKLYVTYGIYVMCTSLSSMFFLKYNKITIIILISLCSRGVGFVNTFVYISSVHIFDNLWDTINLGCMDPQAVHWVDVAVLWSLCEHGMCNLLYLFIFFLNICYLKA
jgi:hypothetical protein